MFIYVLFHFVDYIHWRPFSVMFCITSAMVIEMHLLNCWLQLYCWFCRLCRVKTTSALKADTYMWPFIKSCSPIKFLWHCLTERVKFHCKYSHVLILLLCIFSKLTQNMYIFLCGLIYCKITYIKLLPAVTPMHCCQ